LIPVLLGILAANPSTRGIVFDRPQAAEGAFAEGVYPKRIDGPPERGAAANHVNMLVCTGGRQRSEREFRALYEAAGLPRRRSSGPRARP
jgi:hypothetical protein